MFGLNADIIKLLTNKDALVDKIKLEVPGIVEGLLAVIAQQCGATEEQPTAVVFFTGNDANGQPATMARVHTINPLGDLGEEMGTIDLPAALKAIPNETIKKVLPF